MSQEDIAGCRGKEKKMDGSERHGILPTSSSSLSLKRAESVLLAWPLRDKEESGIRADDQGPVTRRGPPTIFLTDQAEGGRQVHAGPPSGNTTVPYKDSRLLPSHAPPVVTARFESLPPRLLSVLPCTLVLFPFFFLRARA